MLVSQLIQLINSDIVNFDEMVAASPDYTEDPFWYINLAIDFLSNTLIGYQDIEMTDHVTVVPAGTVKPPLWVQFAPKNGFPVQLRAGLFYPADGVSTVDALYYARMPHVTAETQTVPFADCYCGILAQVAAIFILNRNEAEITSDSALLEQSLAALKAAKGA